MKFSEYLKRKRSELSLTQKDLADLMSEKQGLSLLDANTLGRWERAQQIPTQARQRACVLFFGDDPNALMPFDEVMTNGLSDARRKLKRQLANQRFDSLVGGLPLPSVFSINEQAKSTVPETYLQFIADLDLAVLPTPQPISANTIKQWLEHEGGALWLSQHHQQALLHLLCLKLKPESYQQIICGERMESSIDGDDLAKEGEVFCFYIASFFSANIDVTVELYIYLFQFIYRNRLLMQRLGTTIGNNDALKLCRVLSMDIKTFGEVASQPGVQVGNQCYKSVILDAEVYQVMSGSIARCCYSAEK